MAIDTNAQASVAVNGQVLQDMVVDQNTQDPLMLKLRYEKRTAREFQSRKHMDWNDNYDLYRGKVKTNRLTQRQAVMIPLVKETIRTILSRIDDPPHIDWKELSGDETREMIFQELWNDAFDTQNMEGIDMQDKTTEQLYGRSFKKLNWDTDKDTVTVRAMDIYDVVVDPLMNPLDIETARFIIFQNMFKSLRDILADDRYDAAAKEKLKIYLASKEGIVQSSKNKEELQKKLERLKDLGVLSSDFAHFAGGDVLVNLTEHLTEIWSNTEQRFIRRVVTYADDTIPLLNEKLEDLVGVNFWPAVTWADDADTQDTWSDGTADIVRVPNKIVNIWFSQMVENRTLANFGMFWYDATVQGYQPQTYEPGQGRMLPAPGDPNKTIMPVKIDNLDSAMHAIDFLRGVVERSTSATAIEKGSPDQKDATLGEIKILVGNALERTTSIAKFYRRSWYDLAWKWAAMMDANSRKSHKLYKTGVSGKLFEKNVKPSDWKSKAKTDTYPAGYKPIVRSSSEQEAEQTKTLQKFQYVLSQFPNNMALRRIAQNRELDVLDLTPAERREVEDAEKQMASNPGMAMPMGTGANPQNPSMPAKIGPGGPAAALGPGMPQPQVMNQ